MASRLVFFNVFVVSFVSRYVLSDVNAQDQFSDTPIEQLKGDNLLSPFGPVQRQFYIVCSVLIFLVLVGGTIWQVRKGMDEKLTPPKLDIDGIRTMEELMNRQNKELASAMREEVEAFYTSWTREKEKLIRMQNNQLIPDKRHKRKAKDAIMVTTIDEPRYDFTSESTFELMTVTSDTDGVPRPSSFVDFSRPPSAC